MDRAPYPRPSERPASQNQIATHSNSHASPFPPPTAQPPMQIPFADPFHSSRDPFLSGRRNSLGLSSRAWPPQGNAPPPPPSSLHQHHHHQASPAFHHQPSPALTPAPPSQQSLPPPPPNGLGMASPYDSARRRSLGPVGSPPQYSRGHIEALPPPSFPARNMPPPSPPQNAHVPTMPHASAPRGQPSASPFSAPRDINANSHRPGMSISAILGGVQERRPIGSPHSAAVAPSSTPKSMQPPSPARARATSMRESNDRTLNGFSPPRMGLFAEPARTASEPRRDGLYGSPQFRRETGHSFRAYAAPAQEQLHHLNGTGAPMRPTSQPVDMGGPRNIEDVVHRENMQDMRPGTFRIYGEPPVPAESETTTRADRSTYTNGVTSYPQGRGTYTALPIERDPRAQGPPRYSGSFHTPVREDHGSSFRPGVPPTSHPTADMARESIEGRGHDMRRQLSRPSPQPADFARNDPIPNGFADRPMTLEEHQRMELMQREQQRKDSESSVHRQILNISPELDRKGRNSPLPQAVQGAQPRHIGPGGDNPGIKMEFGRMFSGLGSGVGSTPNPLNGISTPSRMSPSRHVDRGDLVRSAVAEIDQRRPGPKPGLRRNGRRSRDDVDQVEGDGRNTPDLQRHQKRTKMNHTHHHHHHHVHPHHHHHHHYEPNEAAAPAFNTIRFPPNPLPQPNVQAHTHHHHHAHPAHHHHHNSRAAPAPATRQPSITVLSNPVIDQCAGKARKHLGSSLYTTELSLPSPTTAFDARPKYSSKMKPIPVFHGKENSLYTVRVPRYYLAATESNSEGHTLEDICSRRQVWGTEIYTDDSDVVAAAVHSGWLQGDFGELNDDLRALDDLEAEQKEDSETSLTLVERPVKPIRVPEGLDAHITLLILPPLEFYASTTQHHIRSREWNKTHDGMSYMIHSIEFVDEGPSSRFVERGATARKHRIALEEANRKEAAAGLLMFANGGTSVRVGA